MFKLFNRRLGRLCFRFRWPGKRRSKPKIVVTKLGKSNSRSQTEYRNEGMSNGSALVHPNGNLEGPRTEEKPIKIATFNAALFSMAPAVPKTGNSTSFDFESEGFLDGKRRLDFNLRTKSANDRPKGILKQSPLHPNAMNGNGEALSKQQKSGKSKLRVSINLPDNEISLLRSRQLSFSEKEYNGGSPSSGSRISRGKAPMRSQSMSYVRNAGNGVEYRSSRTVLEVLRELDCDVLALQDVKAEEEKAMKPLSDLADGLGMMYVFAESWAPEYGNAILSKWPIKTWKVQKIFDDTDFRNVLKATIDVPQTGELNFYCTHLDHLDENWRMKQINAIVESSSEDHLHILAGGLNSLDETDYSAERWTDIVKYYEEIGKPTPKLEVMRYLKSKRFTDSKDLAGDYEPVVMIAKGQNVQGTCKYGTRVDYILASPNSPYKFVPGSYSVFSSKGTSDHHIVRVDIVKASNTDQHNIGNNNNSNRKKRLPKHKVVKINAAANNSTSRSNGIWKIHS